MTDALSYRFWAQVYEKFDRFSFYIALLKIEYEKRSGIE